MAKQGSTHWVLPLEEKKGSIEATFAEVGNLRISFGDSVSIFFLAAEIYEYTRLTITNSKGEESSVSGVQDQPTSPCWSFKFTPDLYGSHHLAIVTTGFQLSSSSTALSKDSPMMMGVPSSSSRNKAQYGKESANLESFHMKKQFDEAPSHSHTKNEKIEAFKGRSSDKEQSLEKAPYVQNSVERLASSPSSTRLKVTIIVDPMFVIAGEKLPTEGICLQTNLSRCLGPFTAWKDMLKLSYDGGYNIIHFSPIETLGESGSCYSIADQLSISPDFLLPGGADAYAHLEEAKKQQLQHTGLSYLKDIVKYLEESYGMLSTTDVVLNHTANNSSWLKDHPESGYNVKNSPHLRGAIELDLAFKKFSDDLVDGKFEQKFGATKWIETEHAIDRVLDALYKELVIPFKMKEYFQIDFASSKRLYNQDINSAQIDSVGNANSKEEMTLLNEAKKQVGVSRGSNIVIPSAISKLLFKDEGAFVAALKATQTELDNMCYKIEASIIENLRGLLRWERISCKKGPVGKNHWEALCQRYFTPLTDCTGEAYHLANNGWVMSWDMTKDFAAAGSLVYLARELIVWSDCVKLRYGQCAEDAPFLWNWMEKYCERIASVFHGIRLDNCHSNPLHVAKHMLKKIRTINPKIWVYAELFTGDRDIDFLFERELGINALIREAMQTYNLEDLGHRAIQYGGTPCGALPLQPLIHWFKVPQDALMLRPKLCPAIFYDCTHDNQTPSEKQTPSNALPLAAVVAGSCCASASSRGFDDLIPKHISVVTDRRLYSSVRSTGTTSFLSTQDSISIESLAGEDDVCVLTWSNEAKEVCAFGGWDDWKKPIVLHYDTKTERFVAKLDLKTLEAGKRDFQYKFIVDGVWRCNPALPTIVEASGNVNNIFGSNSEKQASLKDTYPLAEGFLKIKQLLNNLHKELAFEGFSEVALCLKSSNLIIIHRHNPINHRGVYFIVSGAYSWENYSDNLASFKFCLSGKIKCVRLMTTLSIRREDLERYQQNPFRINGLDGKLINYDKLSDLAKVVYDEVNDATVFELLGSFVSGSVVVLETEGYSALKKTIGDQLGLLPIVCDGIDLLSYNFLLYSCNNEELDRSAGKRGVYNFPGYGDLKYAGICGIIPVLNIIRLKQWNEHPVLANFKAGMWFLEYQIERLRGRNEFEPLLLLLQQLCKLVKEVPQFLYPFYIDLLFSHLFQESKDAIKSKMNVFVRTTKDTLVETLALATLQFYGYVPSSPLVANTQKASLSAGLPHFSTGFMRNWGRDTFLALKGVLLVTGRFEEARAELLAYAEVVRHHLVPNLLDGGNKPRYNARDATWYFLQSIVDYCSLSTEGIDFLHTMVKLKYPSGEGDNHHDGGEKKLSQLMHEILSAHVKGFNFREWNAGRELDENMTDEGFNVSIWFSKENGLIFGGNRHNCGTWMDKMGSSMKAGNAGIPASPRNGAAIELIGVLKSVLRFINKLPVTHFPYREASLGFKVEGKNFCYSMWEELLEKQFERCFYIPAVDDKNFSSYMSDKALVKKSRIYKDTYQGIPSADYQLRPNVCVAMALSPEIFVQEHASECLNIIDDALLNEEDQIGMKTLDHEDSDYSGDYDNGNDSNCKSIAHGWNYHQGPEWLWPVGYYLKAKYNFFNRGRIAPGKLSNQQLSMAECRILLRNIEKHLCESLWMSLPELTNANGRHCEHSCSAQAWSVGCILSCLYTP